MAIRIMLLITPPIRRRHTRRCFIMLHDAAISCHSDAKSLRAMTLYFHFIPSPPYLPILMPPYATTFADAAATLLPTSHATLLAIADATYAALPCRR